MGYFCRGQVTSIKKIGSNLQFTFKSNTQFVFSKNGISVKPGKMNILCDEKGKDVKGIEEEEKISSKNTFL